MKEGGRNVQPYAEGYNGGYAPCVTQSWALDDIAELAPKLQLSNEQVRSHIVKSARATASPLKSIVGLVLGVKTYFPFLLRDLSVQTCFLCKSARTRINILLR
jgi:hypothetical protein